MISALPFTLTLLIAAPSTADPALVGTWTSEQPLLSDPFAGPIEVSATDKTLRIWMAGETYTARQRPSKQGGLYAVETPYGSIRLRRAQDSLRGFWIQANEGGQAWATPLRFEDVGPGRARAQVRPYRARRPLIIQISPGKKGELRALGRDVERNLGRYLGLTTLTRAGRKVTFLRRSGAPLIGTLDKNTLTLPLPDGGPSLRLRRQDTVVGLRSRQTPYRYRVPTADPDWPTATPAKLGLKPEVLENLARELGSQEPSSIYDPQVHALLVARRGTLVLEEYYFGHGPDRLHDTRSAGKSLASMLAGATALQTGMGARAVLGTKICSLTPEYAKACASDPRKSEIRLEHLLSMSSGLRCDDDDSESPGNEDRMQSQADEEDWYRYILAVPVARAADTKAVYCSAGVNLVGAGLRALNKTSVVEAFDSYLARPRNIEHYHQNLMPTGEGYLAGGIRLRPRDALKFGEVMRSKGTWKGRRIVSEPWVEASWAPQGSIHERGDYGLGWWRTTKRIGDRTVKVFYASGNGGQLIFVVPELEMVVLFMGGNYGNFGTWRRFRDDYLPRTLGAVGDDEPRH